MLQVASCPDNTVMALCTDNKLKQKLKKHTFTINTKTKTERDTKRQSGCLSTFQSNWSYTDHITKKNCMSANEAPKQNVSLALRFFSCEI